MNFSNTRAENNFDFLRFMAAILVLLSHCFPLINNAKSEPLNLLTGGRYSLGDIAVFIFFILSGFLITASWDKKRKLIPYIKSRLYRIFPALLMLLFCTIVVGFFITTETLNRYIPSALVYFMKNLFLFKGEVGIAGVFNNLPYPHVINGSLWTLRHELSCYILIAMLGLMNILNLYVMTVLWFFVTILALNEYPLPHFFIEFIPLAVWFLSGSIVYLIRNISISQSILISIFCSLVLFIFLGLNPLTLSPLISFLLITWAYQSKFMINFGRYGDFSYGVYIYAFPIQQLIIFIGLKYHLPVTWWFVFCLSLPITLFSAYLSWSLIEKRFLILRSS